jgi:hypothetical protein
VHACTVLWRKHGAVPMMRIAIMRDRSAPQVEPVGAFTNTPAQQIVPWRLLLLARRRRAGMLDHGAPHVPQHHRHASVSVVPRDVQLWTLERDALHRGSLSLLSRGILETKNCSFGRPSHITVSRTPATRRPVRFSQLEIMPVKELSQR